MFCFLVDFQPRLVASLFTFKAPFYLKGLVIQVVFIKLSPPTWVPLNSGNCLSPLPKQLGYNCKRTSNEFAGLTTITLSLYYWTSDRETVNTNL